MNKAIAQVQDVLNERPALLTVLAILLLFNSFLYMKSDGEPFGSKLQARTDASGFSADKAQKFVYFYYYTGNFPLATLNSELTFSEEAAREEIETNGEQLIMEYQHWSRLGENARIWAYLPNAIIDGSAEEPSIKLFNVLVFMMSLFILYLGFWRIKLSLLGLLLVVSINLTPFFWFEVFSRENIFGLMASSFFIVLGLNVGVLFGRRRFRLRSIGIAILSAVSVGFFSEFRNEISVVLLSLLLIYALSQYFDFKQKLAYCAIIFLVYFGTKKTIQGFFNNKFEATKDLVAEKGGHVYTGDRIKGHTIWHAIFCGLGDYDREKGYVWDDRVAYRYAVPILNEKYDLNISYSGKYHTDDYYDEDRLYYIKFDEIPLYGQVVREKVLSDILEDPGWYVSILTKRVSKTLSTTLPLPYIGWSIFLLVFMLLIMREYTYLKLLLVSLPLSATSIIVYSARGSTYNSVFVYFVLAISILVLFKLYDRLNPRPEEILSEDELPTETTVDFAYVSGLELKESERDDSDQSDESE